MSQSLPKKILVKIIKLESNLDISFFVPVTYEALPKNSMHCTSFAHTIEAYFKNQNWRDTQPLYKEDTRKSDAYRRRDNVEKGTITQGNSGTTNATVQVQQNNKNQCIAYATVELDNSGTGQ